MKILGISFAILVCLLAFVVAWHRQARVTAEITAFCFENDELRATVSYKNLTDRPIKIAHNIEVVGSLDRQRHSNNTFAEFHVISAPLRANEQREDSVHFRFTVKAQSLFAVVTSLEIIEEEPNQALVPTPASVTPAADAPVAPDAGAAHL